MVISEKKKCPGLEFGHMKSAADSTRLIVVCATSAYEHFSFLKTIFVHGKFYN
jgi:hypothetical protein